MSSANVYFVEFEQVNIYFRKFDTWSLKLFDSFIFIHYDCVRRMFTSFIRYLFKWIWFFVFQIKMKNEKQTSNLNFNVQLFWKSENHLFWCFLSQLQYRNKNQNLISNFIFQFIKKNKTKRNGTLGTRIIKRKFNKQRSSTAQLLPRSFLKKTIRLNKWNKINTRLPD